MENKQNKLIISRGLPGSGKTTLASKLCQQDIDSGLNAVMIAADDFFTVNGEYKFDFKLINAAHQYCFGTAFFHLSRGCNVYVHNTSTQRWQIEPYVDLACKNGYQWHIIEPTTKWRYDVSECTKRNTHGVPEATIQKMKDQWESTKDLLKAFEKYEIKT